MNPDQEFVAVSYSRAEIAQDLNDHMDTCGIHVDRLLPNDVRLTDAICTRIAKELGECPLDGYADAEFEVHANALRRLGLHDDEPIDRG